MTKSYNEIIKYLNNKYLEAKAANAAGRILFALDSASTNIELAKYGGPEYVDIAINILMAAGLIKEGAHVEDMYKA